MPAVLHVAVVAAGLLSSYHFTPTPMFSSHPPHTTIKSVTTSPTNISTAKASVTPMFSSHPPHTTIKSVTTSPTNISTAKASVTPMFSSHPPHITIKSVTPSITKSTSKSTTTSPVILPSPNTSTTQNKTWWKPSAGATWSIDIYSALKLPTVNVAVYDIDLFDNTATTINSLHSLSHKVICYFSAGSYEDFRPDASEWTSGDYGNALGGWPGEWWANTNSANVRNIMIQRLDLAVQKGCDGVDPDNIDAYGNNNGLGLTQDDAVNYVTFLAMEAHSRGLAIGLKNGGEILPRVINNMEWSVNEQCEKYKECDLFRPFINAGKPVFHIEYPNDAPNVSAAGKAKICGYKKAAGFSTVLKKLSLGSWAIAC